MSKMCLLTNYCLSSYLWNIGNDFINHSQWGQTRSVSHSASDFVRYRMLFINIEANSFSQNDIHGSGIRKTQNSLHDQIGPFFICNDEKFFFSSIKMTLKWSLDEMKITMNSQNSQPSAGIFSPLVRLSDITFLQKKEHISTKGHFRTKRHVRTSRYY